MYVLYLKMRTFEHHVVLTVTALTHDKIGLSIAESAPWLFKVLCVSGEAL